MLRLERLSGDKLNHFIPELAQLRIQVFRDWPYLYDGDLAYEEKYLQTYIEAPDSVIVLAFDGDKVVGASTGIPLQHETDEVKAPFIAAGYDVSKIFYCGESVLLSEYRGQGAGVAFLTTVKLMPKRLVSLITAAFVGYNARPNILAVHLTMYR